MAKIFVGCKLPHGLVMELVEAQLDPQTKKPLQVLHPRPADPDRPRVVLNGSNSVVNRIARMSQPPAYGKTLVDEEFANAWFGVNKNSAFVRSGAVFSAKTESEFEAKAREALVEKSGFEPLDPNKDVVSEDGVVVTADPDRLNSLRGVAARA